MRAWLRDLLDIALLRTETLARLSSRPDAFLQGFLAVVLVALIVGLPVLVSDLAALRRVPEPADTAAALSGVRQALDAAATAFDALGLPPAVRDQAREAALQGFELGLRLGSEVAALPTPLPRPVGALFRAAGSWAARPFAAGGFPLAAAALGTWLGYGVWVMLFAKLLGGRGTLHGFFGATGFFALPHLLHLFAGLPVLGAVLGVVAFAWGVVIYVKATAVSHQLPMAQAALAVALPLIAAGVLVALLLPVAAGIIALFIAAVAG
ncbi:MAG: YIP1 family protein [Anaerolineae bacterium]